MMSSLLFFLVGCSSEVKLEETSEEQPLQQVQPLQEKVDRYESILSKIFPDWHPEKTVFSKDVTVTCYTSRPEETDDTPWTTSSNTNVRPGIIAVSRDLYPLLIGKTVILEGYGTFKVRDKMNARYANSVDIWCGDLEAAKRHGRRATKMIWLSE
jgi:3D (Asp-Asp-Asp) domain-containing protein